MLLLGFLFITVLATFVAADVSTLWPQPKSVTTGSLQAQLAPDFSIVIGMGLLVYTLPEPK